MTKLSGRSGRMLALLGGLLVLGACGRGGALECEAGLLACGDRCVDPQSNEANCGACGTTCATLQVCTEGVCGCREGTEACGGACVDVANDARNCGACGVACNDGQVCQASSCSGATVVAACGGTAQVVAVGHDGAPGTPVQLTTSGLQALGHFQQNVLASSYGADVFQLNPSVAPTDATISGFNGVNAFLAEPPYLYVVNTNANTLVVLEQTGGSAEAGWTFEKLNEVTTGENTSPQAAVRVGNRLYVPLYGNFMGDPTQGQKVAVFDMTAPTAPVRVPAEDIDLGALDLQPYDGLSPLPTPYGVVEFGGNLYLPLNSLTLGFEIGGPGMLAKVTLPERTVSTVELDPALCENVGDVEKVGDQLVVSCIGRPTYDGNWNVVAVEKSSVLLLDANDAVVDAYVFACDAEGCPPASTTRLAVAGARVYVGDGQGRVVILDAGASGFTEVRGFSATAPQPAAQVCPPSETASNQVADLVVVE